VSELDDVKREVAIANRVLSEVGLATGVLASLGHASLRLPSEPDKFVTKGRGYPNDALIRMRPEDMVVCDMEGYKVGGPPGVTQCMEIKMHSSVYKVRPDVMSIVHVHPRYTVIMSVLKKTLLPVCQEGIHLVRYPLPIYPHVKTVQSDQEGKDVADALGQEKILLLYGHGVTVTGVSLSDSVQSTMQLEEQAKMNWYAYCAAGPDYQGIPDDLIEEMTARPRPAELPHFIEPMKEKAPVVGEGVWTHYAEIVSRDL
jgi:L-fuculose-phosphate aldolase